MRYSTLSTYDMSCKYKEWIPETRADGQEYRDYAHDGPVENLPCRIVVNTVGALVIYSPVQLQVYAMVYDFVDPSGTLFMNDMFYAIRDVRPIFDPMGNINAYLHNLVTLSSTITNAPISPKPDLGFDQG